jgi:hypothetical protein
MENERQPDSDSPSATRRGFLAATAAGAAGLFLRSSAAADPARQTYDAPVDGQKRAKISLRVGFGRCADEARLDELLAFVKQYKDVIDEIAFIPGFTHPPAPQTDIESRAAVLAGVIPRFKKLGFSTGINHIATIGHLDENLENSLREPWQHLVDFDGTVSASCYCTADPRMRDYVRACLAALAKSGPDFIWIDDDVRLEAHGRIRFACFCDHCMEAFSKQTGKSWDRAALVTAMRSGPRGQRLALRREWLAHNRAYIKELLTNVREAVDGVDPNIILGLMTGETAYSGYGSADFAPVLAGPRNRPVKWRPGGGFYVDDTPPQLLGKAHQVGRQISFVPQSIGDIQYELENFPYQRLKKSVTIFTAEIAAAIGAGSTGAALNCLGIADESADEYQSYFDAIRARRRFYDKAVAAFGRSPSEGVWTAFTRDHFAVSQADGDWFAPLPFRGSDLQYINEFAEIGIPLAYSPQGARTAALSGDGCFDFSEEELLKLLGGGLILDGPALARLHEMGLGEHTGFAVRGKKEKDTMERFSDDPLNGRFAGRRRDCRPSFYPETAWLIEPLSPQSRPLSEIVDFTAKSFGPTSGVFENRLGGRVAVFGYYPWRSLQSLAKTSQIKAVCRWLSRDALPACVASYAKAAVWCRRDPRGRQSVLLLNASLDPQPSIALLLLDAGPLEMTRAGGQTEVLRKTGMDGPYSIFDVPRLSPWEPVLLTSISTDAFNRQGDK